MSLLQSVMFTAALSKREHVKYYTIFWSNVWSFTVPDACTLEEALDFRKQLRHLGKERFIDETIFAGKVSAKKLCTAFGIMPPAVLSEAPDEAFYGLLAIGLEREIRKRHALRENLEEPMLTGLQAETSTIQ